MFCAMNRCLLLIGVLLLGWPGAAIGQSTFVWEARHMHRVKRTADTARWSAQLRQLRGSVEAILRQGPYTVTDKEVLPPSGDKRDYLSYSRYWWPDPSKPDGKPYVRKDGKTNHELIRQGDRYRLRGFTTAVQVLSLGAFFFDDERCVRRADELIRVWFLDERTRMNPHVRFGQSVPGGADGRSEGLLDTRDFIFLLEAVAVLDHVRPADPRSRRALQQWFTEYDAWLRRDPLGREAAKARNNHGTWYEAQAARVALCLNQERSARVIVRRVARERAGEHFQQDGSQPEELRRTQSLLYSCFNLEAYAVLARIGEHVGVDLWRDGKRSTGIERGIRYVLPALTDATKWPHKQTSEYAMSRGARGLLRMASVRYRDPAMLAPLRQSQLKGFEQVYAQLVFAAAE